MILFKKLTPTKRHIDVFNKDLASELSSNYIKQKKFIEQEKDWGPIWRILLLDFLYFFLRNIKWWYFLLKKPPFFCFCLKLMGCLDVLIWSFELWILILWNYDIIRISVLHFSFHQKGRMNYAFQFKILTSNFCFTIVNTLNFIKREEWIMHFNLKFSLPNFYFTITI